MRGIRTKEGLTKYLFTDTSGIRCSIQEGGGADPEGPTIWLGSHPRMLLSRDQVADLMPYFTYFLENGDLPEPGVNHG